MTTSLSGGCHCGNISVVFESDMAPDQIGVRADQRSFCRKHGARTITDPKGRVKLTVRAAENLILDRFGLKSADYLVCGRCGVYVAGRACGAGLFVCHGQHQHLRLVGKPYPTSYARLLRG